LELFDVEAAAGLRREVLKEKEQLRIMLSWKQAGSKGANRDGSGPSHSEERLDRLITQLDVLEEFISAMGGWAKAVEPATG
jgi:hypothetical protein